MRVATVPHMTHVFALVNNDAPRGVYYGSLRMSLFSYAGWPPTMLIMDLERWFRRRECDARKAMVSVRWSECKEKPTAEDGL